MEQQKQPTTEQLKAAFISGFEDKTKRPFDLEMNDDFFSIYETTEAAFQGGQIVGQEMGE
jgi:hypothetical protein